MDTYKFFNTYVHAPYTFYSREQVLIENSHIALLSIEEAALQKTLLISSQAYGYTTTVHRPMETQNIYAHVWYYIAT